MWILLLVSLFCLMPPFTGIGVGGILAWSLLSLLFRHADDGVEQMATEIQQGNTGAGGCLLVAVFLFVGLGGVAVLGIFLTVAGGGR